MNNVKIFVSVIGILFLGIIATVLLRTNATPPGPGKYDTFATCLKDQGATFYGAFWCPHCKTQKELFGSSAKLLPYVECALADASGQNQLCNDKQIQSYPTWEFADGSRLTGEIPLTQLAEKTSCVLPEDETTPTPLEAGASSSTQ
jgi:thiol-disulfide isomerase/thioredoxin